MDAFIIELKNQPGTFAKVTDAAGSRGINIICAGAAFADFGLAVVVSDDDDALRSALTDIGADFRAVRALSVRLDNRPGTAAEVSKLLADEGINLDVFLPMEICEGHAVATIACDNPDRAKELLGDRVVG
jgi:hypothetical protein